MSFCSEVKSEICSHKISSRCCRRAECAGLSFGIRVKKNGTLCFKTAGADVAQLALRSFERHYGECRMIVSNSGLMYSVETVNAFTGSFSPLPADGITVKDCCVASFIKGVFLACGQLANPGSTYRLDLNLSDAESAQAVAQRLCTAGFVPKISQKSSGKATVYFKNSSLVGDLLTYMGATMSTLGMMEVMVEKDYKNHINRTVNFETANLVRTVGSGAAQLEAINRIAASVGLDTLPAMLRETAQLRLDNPDASLASLAALAGVSKSGLNHRLARLVELADKNGE